MKFNVSACCHPDYPIFLEKAVLSYSNGMSESFHNLLNAWNWGCPYPFLIDSEEDVDFIPMNLDAYWSVEEKKYYFSINEDLPIFVLDTLKKEDTFENIVFGFAPCDGFTMWCHGPNKSIVVKSSLQLQSEVGKYMQQFTYRYLVLFEHWDKDKEQWCSDSKSSPTDGKFSQTESNKEETKPEFDYIEEALFDGTHDKLHDGGLMNYHQAGKPKKLAVKWHVKKTEYTAYFWFEDDAIREVFDRFYGTHPDTKTDFMIRIDSDNKKFELALYRYGLKEPQVVSKSSYQLLVFKNKFEYYRSENYNQPRGAWIW